MKEGNSKKTALEEKYKVRMQELSVSLKISILFFYGFAPFSFGIFLAIHVFLYIKRFSYN